MTEELKACPFCSSEQVTTSPCENITDDVRPEITWAASCKACGARVDRDTEAEAIAAWNTRIEPEAADRGVSEALEQIQLLASNHGGWVENDPQALVTQIHGIATTAIQSLRSEQDQSR